MPDTVQTITLLQPIGFWRRVALLLVETVCILTIIGVGIATDSGAMQWIGFLLVVLLAWVYAVRTARDARMSPQAAANLLRRDYGVVGVDPMTGA